MGGELSWAELQASRKRINERIRKYERENGKPGDQVRAEIAFSAFLYRLFSYSDRWVLKGGTALILRNGDGRFTKDIDLSLREGDLIADDVREELEAAVQVSFEDPFSFEISSVKSAGGVRIEGYSTSMLDVHVVAYLGSKKFRAFGIDVSVCRHTQMPVEEVFVDPSQNVVLKEFLSTPLRVLVTPIESHLADKVCAMYEIHGDRASTRYHDLVDIIQIIRTQNFQAQKLAEILEHEARRRGIKRPSKMVSPGAEWEAKFGKKAPEYRLLPTELYDLEAAVDFAGSCLNEVPDGRRTAGYWDSATGEWRD